MEEVQKRLRGRFDILARLGAGSFGTVWKARDCATGDVVAIKAEAQQRGCGTRLLWESKVRQQLPDHAGFPRQIWFKAEDAWVFIAMDLLSHSLSALAQHCGGVLSPATVLMLAIQIIPILRVFHNAGFVHADVKPANFVLGRGDKRNQVHLVDYGSAKRWLDFTTKEHVQDIPNARAVVGTIRYMSVNVHQGHTPSRRDDLISLGYMFVFLLKGTLPWVGLRSGCPASTMRAIMQAKADTPLHALCDGLPAPVLSFLQHATHLDFYSPPDYMRLMQEFTVELNRIAPLPSDRTFDWEKLCLDDDQEAPCVLDDE